MIKFKDGYKYQLAENYEVQTNIIPHKIEQHDFVELSASGLLTIYQGYAWDGASGPAIDTKSILRASLVHDALYQLIRMGIVDPWQKQLADVMFYNIMLEDGVWKPRAWWVYRAVQKFGKFYLFNNPNEVLIAP